MHKKDELSRRLCPEGWWPENYNSWSTSPSKLLLHDSRINFKKSNVTWQDPKEALTSLKSWWTINDYFSSSVEFLLVEKESNLFFIQSKTNGSKQLKAQDLHTLMNIFLKSIKSWKMMKKWLDYWTLCAMQV